MFRNVLRGPPATNVTYSVRGLGAKPWLAANDDEVCAVSQDLDNNQFNAPSLQYCYQQ